MIGGNNEYIREDFEEIAKEYDGEIKKFKEIKNILSEAEKLKSYTQLSLIMNMKSKNK